jgi:hypothetical protein
MQSRSNRSPWQIPLLTEKICLDAPRKVMIDKENTTIVGGAGKKTDIQARIGRIKAEIEETTSDCDREKLQERLAKLAGGVGVIRVGGATEVGLWCGGKPCRANRRENPDGKTYQYATDHSVRRFAAR